jgi:hypothetical protein
MMTSPFQVVSLGLLFSSPQNRLATKPSTVLSRPKPSAKADD